MKIIRYGHIFSTKVIIFEIDPVTRPIKVVFLRLILSLNLKKNIISGLFLFILQLRNVLHYLKLTMLKQVF